MVYRIHHGQVKFNLYNILWSRIKMKRKNEEIEKTERKSRIKKQGEKRNRELVLVTGDVRIDG